MTDTNTNFTTSYDEGFLTAEVGEHPDFNGGYEVAMNGDPVPKILIEYRAMPDLDLDLDTDPWPDEIEQISFALDPAQAVRFAKRLLEIAAPLAM